MRTTVAVMVSTSVLVVGLFAISEAAQQSEQPAIDAGGASQDAWNTSVDVYGGLLGGGGEGIVWFGIAAIVLVALGLLVAASGGGR